MPKTVASEKNQGKNVKKREGQKAKKIIEVVKTPQYPQLKDPKLQRALEAALEKKEFRRAASRNPDLSETWKTREFETMSKNELVFDRTSTEWDWTQLGSGKMQSALLSAIVAKIDATAPGFFASDTTTSAGIVQTLSPADCMMYMYLCAVTYMCKIGSAPVFLGTVLQGDVSALKLKVPFALACVLQHFAPYKKNGFSFRSYTQNATGMTTGANSAVQLSGTASSSAYGIVATVGKYSAKVPALTGEIVGNVGSASSSFATIRSIADGISALLSTVCETVEVDSIPIEAPDSSAYSTVSDNLGTSVDITVGNPIEGFDSELGFLLGKVTTGSPYLNALAPAPAVSPLEGASPNTQLPSSTTTVTYKRNWMILGLVENLWKVPSKLGVPVKQLLLKSDYGRITSFVVIPKTVNLDLWHAYIMSLEQGLVGFNQRDISMHFVMYFDAVLAAKLGEYNMWSRTNDAAYYFYDRDFLAGSLPLHAKQFIESLGPVIRNGRLQIPQMLYTGGDWYNSLMSTTLKNNGANAYPFQGMMNTGNTAAYASSYSGSGAGIVPGTGTWTAGNLYPITPSVFTDKVKQDYARAVNVWGSLSSTNGVGQLLPTFPLDAITVLGDIVNHVSCAIATGGTTASGSNDSALGAPRDVSITAIASNAPLSRIDCARVLQATFFRANGVAAIGSGSFDGFPYVARVAGGCRPAGAIAEADVSTFAREAATNTVTAVKRGGIRSINGHTVDVTASNPLMLALAPVIAMGAASLLPAAVNFVTDKLQPRKPSLQYSNFGDAPPKVTDLIADGQRRFEQVQQMYSAYKGSGAAGLGAMAIQQLASRGLGGNTQVLPSSALRGGY
jgi:hypothetical protein